MSFESFQDRLVPSQMCLGREFQREVAAVARAPSAQVQSLVPDDDDRRLASECGGGQGWWRGRGGACNGGLCEWREGPWIGSVVVSAHWLLSDDIFFKIHSEFLPSSWHGSIDASGGLLVGPPLQSRLKHQQTNSSATRWSSWQSCSPKDEPHWLWWVNTC